MERQTGLSTNTFSLHLPDGTKVFDCDILGDVEIEDGDQLDLLLVQSGGKPVILLYPPAPLKATVAVKLNPLWSFSALYQRPLPNKLKQASATEVGRVMMHSPH